MLHLRLTSEKFAIFKMAIYFRISDALRIMKNNDGLFTLLHSLFSKSNWICFNSENRPSVKTSSKECLDKIEILPWSRKDNPIALIIIDIFSRPRKYVQCRADLKRNSQSIVAIRRGNSFGKALSNSNRSGKLHINSNSWQ